MKAFEKLQLKAYAKVNISLDITGLLDNGMHQVETIIHTISLADTVLLEVNKKSKPDNKISVSSDKYFIPTNEKNLAYRAASVVLEDFSHITEPIRINIHKVVPVGAGLGGGSGDAAATIRGLNQLLNLGLSGEKMENYASKIGSDVPALLNKGAYLATGTGTQLNKISSLRNCKAVLVNPGVFISTKEVYSLYDTYAIPSDAHPDTAKIVDAMAREDYDCLVGELKNVLEIPVFTRHPRVAELKRELIKLGCDTALMSGSGSTVYGISKDIEKIEDIKKTYINKGYKAFVVDFIG